MDEQTLTDDQIIRAMIDNKGLVTLAARKLNCTPQALSERIKSIASVQQIVDANREELVDLAEAKLRAAMLNGEPWAISFVLKTLGGRRGYDERQDATGADDNLKKVSWKIV